MKEYYFFGIVLNKEANTWEIKTSLSTSLGTIKTHIEILKQQDRTIRAAIAMCKITDVEEAPHD